MATFIYAIAPLAGGGKLKIRMSRVAATITALNRKRLVSLKGNYYSWELRLAWMPIGHNPRCL